MIAYHGTCAENVQSIMEQGFRPESWFARDIKDALVYGGPCIFSVWFCDLPSLWHGESWEGDWQFHISDWHKPEHIKAVKFHF